ncbi:membrane protein, putative [Babesia bigemina]|uniref:Membrane protein, putative n=1 Tax=Babesia bigemina TaxID=5866 RepID=A0A061D6W0_BABBI|nr:membrane protein, putative [Babesia bigemina]CDR94669.1 membrane protein, putative [Babesia bigemina]|eukprot:XP_012766855.1 membrane protein, putative [Babesia bigemina]
MELYWLLVSVISLWSVQAAPVLHNPFQVDAPLPLINLLQIGGIGSDAVTDVSPSATENTASGSFAGEGATNGQGAPAEAHASSDAPAEGNGVPAASADVTQPGNSMDTAGLATNSNYGNVTDAASSLVEGEAAAPGLPNVGGLDHEASQPPTMAAAEAGQANSMPADPTTTENVAASSSPVLSQGTDLSSGNIPSIDSDADDSILSDSSATTAQSPAENVNGGVASGDGSVEETIAPSVAPLTYAGQGSTEGTDATDSPSGSATDSTGQPETSTEASPASDTPTSDNAQPAEGTADATQAGEAGTTEPGATESETPATDNGESADASAALSTEAPPSTLIGEETPTEQAPEIPSDSYNKEDMEKNSDATKIDLGDVIEGGNQNLSNMTEKVDQEWLNKESTAESIQEKLPEGTGYTYNKSARMLTPVVQEPKMMGGVLQTLIDKEAEIRRRTEQAVHIEHDLRLRVTRETAEVVALLTNEDLFELKRSHPLVFMRIVEPLKVAVAMGQLNKSAHTIVSTYDRSWYVRATPKEKADLLANIRRDTGRAYLFASKVKKPKQMTPEKSSVYQKLDEFFNDYQCQKIIRGNQVAKQMLRMFSESSGLYVAPFYTDVVPTLGSLWMIARFEKFYSQSEMLRAEVLAKSLPQMVGRFMVMVENGTLLPTSINLQANLYSLATMLSKIMDGVAGSSKFMGKRKFYGFMGMCDASCARGIETDAIDGDASKKFVLNKQREILRWVSFYLRDDLLRIDTTVQKTMLELMFRTTNSEEFILSPKNVKLHLKSEIVKNNGPSMLELPRRRSKQPKEPKAPKQKAQAKDDDKERKVLMGRFMSGYRLPGRRVNNNADFRDIAPYNSFKTPAKLVASLDNGLLNMLEVISDVVNLTTAGDSSNLYFQAFNTWVQLQSFHAAIHAFEPNTSRRKTTSKTLGAVFRFLNMSASAHIESMPRQFLPFTSLILQLSFYFQNSVDGYERGKLKGLKTFFKGLMKFGLRSRLGPSNFDELHSYFETQVVYNKARYSIGRAVVAKLTSDFKMMFLGKPAVPTPIIQLITVYVGLWTRGSAAALDFADYTIDPVRKAFFLGYLSNKSDLSTYATEIIVQHCASKAPVLHLGCLKASDKGRRSCKQVSFRTNKSDVLKLMQTLDATLENPLDTVRIASDTARRCNAMPARTGIRSSGKKATSRDVTMLFSELAMRYQCYKAQVTAAGQLVKILSNLKDQSAVQSTIDNFFSSMRTITIKHSTVSENGPTLVCPFMDDAPEELRNRHRSRIVEYVMNRVKARRGALGIFKKIGSIFSGDKSSGVKGTVTSRGPLDNIAGCIFVGTRSYDGILFHGGFAPPEKIPIPESVAVRPGEGRVVYNGENFVSEIEALGPSTGVKAVTLEQRNGETRRKYVMESGDKFGEISFATKFKDFVVRAHVLTTASALRGMGYDIGKFIWCGYEHGWVADFALNNVIGNSDIPVFNGDYWVLSKQMVVADVVGQKVPIKNGEQIKDASVQNVNVEVKSGDGNSIARYPSNQGSPSSFITSGDETTFTFDTGYGNVSPAAVRDLVRNAEFDSATNTLVINLDAPVTVLQESPISSAG